MKILLPVLVLLIFSCRPIKPVAYLEYSLDTTGLSQLSIPEPIIQKGDFLGIIIHSESATASAVYQRQYTGNNPSTGYLVDQYGYIAMPTIGRVHVEGMSKKRLADSLANYFVKNNLLTNPRLDIRFLNYKITVIGEVARPNVFTAPGEKITILEAIGMAGDLTPFAKRNNITVIREANGQRTFGRLDLDSESIFNSPYYHLQQNDIVIVDKSDRRKREPERQRTRETISIVTGIAATIAVVVSLLTR